MKRVSLRVYEELNEHVPEGKRKHAFEIPFEGAVTVSALLQAAGIPICEVDLALCNGEPVGPAHAIADGDRLSVYPVFESLNIKESTRFRQEPLRRPAFVVGPGLERLAASLRRLGFDAVSFPGAGMEELARIAEAGKRILVTRDEAPARAVSRLIRVCGRSAPKQVEEIVARLDLRLRGAPAQACSKSSAGGGSPDVGCAFSRRGRHGREPRGG
jgi:sulfur carrier protein ThiS